MVSKPVQPFIIPVVIHNTDTGVSSNQGALIDSGFTRCLIRRSVVDELSIRVVALNMPIRFKQMDGSIMGGAPASHVMELIRVEIGEHWEPLRFIVDRMIDP